MLYTVIVQGTIVYQGDDPRYAIEHATMLRDEEPEDVPVVIELYK